jgi:hypothetical protein
VGANAESGMSKYNDRYMDRLIVEFHRAAQFLIDRVQNDDWVWSSNYLREHVRCATGMKFTNSISPEILRELRARYPELAPWIETTPIKGEDNERAA